MSSKIYVLLPVHNESKSIYDLLNKYAGFIRKYSLINHEITVVNDCSRDDTEDWILKAKSEISDININYIKNETNKGLHRVLAEGFERFENIGKNDVLITMDGDNTHNPFLIREMLQKIDEGSDIVIASRYCEQSRIHGLRRFRIFLSVGAKYLYNLRWNIKGVKDYTCGFRAYRGWIVKDYIEYYKNDLIKIKGFTANSEILKKMNKFNPVIVEVPMILNYSNKLQPSNMSVFKTIYLTLKMLIRN